MGSHYLALLRGINVGGKNRVLMSELREAFEELGFTDVATYIASGNVLFRAPRQRCEKLAARLETELSRRFKLELRVVVLTARQLQAAVEDAPSGFGADTHRSDVIFLRPPLTAKKAFPVFDLKDGVDEAWPGKNVVYHRRLAARASSSRLSKIVATPEYQNMTIRSWSTARKLAALLDSR